MIINSLFTRGWLVLVCATGLLAFTPATRAQVPPDQAKMAGAIPLTLQLLNTVDKFTKNVNGDAAITAEWNASMKDHEISSDSPSKVIDSKYPKLAAAFKAAGLSPEDFTKAYGAIFVTTVLAEMGTPTEDKNAEANIAFYKANKDRMTATTNALKALDRGANSSPSAAPSVSPASRP